LSPVPRFSSQALGLSTQCNTPKFKEIQGARYVFHHNPRILLVTHIT
jgi:hypothetical protein